MRQIFVEGDTHPREITHGEFACSPWRIMDRTEASALRLMKWRDIAALKPGIKRFDAYHLNPEAGLRCGMWIVVVLKHDLDIATIRSQGGQGWRSGPDNLVVLLKAGRPDRNQISKLGLREKVGGLTDSIPDSRRARDRVRNGDGASAA